MIIGVVVLLAIWITGHLPIRTVRVLRFAGRVSATLPPFTSTHFPRDRCPLLNDIPVFGDFCKRFPARLLPRFGHVVAMAALQKASPNFSPLIPLSFHNNSTAPISLSAVMSLTTSTTSELCGLMKVRNIL